jgi:hypothetical protein
MALQQLEGLAMGQVGRTEVGMHSYSLKPGYNIGDLSGARGYQYVWDANDRISGQCLQGYNI